jgi:tetratricopeptide (TPR) repeat protein
LEARTIRRRAAVTIFVGLCLAAALPAVSSIAARQDRSEPAAVRISRDWRRLVSADLEVIGNASERDLRRTLEEVQNFRDTLRRLMTTLDFGSDQKTILIALRDAQMFERFAPRDGRGRKRVNVAGYFSVQPYANVMVLPIYAEREFTYEVAFHEYVHFLVYRNLRNVPRWLSEGLAEFYSTYFVDSRGRAIIGRPPPGWVATLRIRPMLSLSKFLDPESSARLFDNPAAANLFYAQAWALVHFMTLSDRGARQGQILKYLQALQTSSSHLDAARQAFGTDLNRLSADVERYVNRDELPALTLARPEKQAAAHRVEVAPLTEADAWHVQGRLLTDVEATEDAEKALVKALAQAPGHRGARVAMGRVRLQQERRDEAVAVLTAAAGEASDDFEPQYYLGTALAAVHRYEESLKAYDRAVAINPQSALAWFGLSQAALALKRDSHADAAMRQVQGRYSDPSWYYSRAQFAFGLGRNELAIRDIDQYLTLAGWADESAVYAAFIGAIAHSRLSQLAEAEALLALASRAASPKSWTAIVVQYLQGHLNDEAFLDRARDNGQRTEAHAYIGLRLLLADRKDQARQHFLWVKTQGDRHYTEYRLALAELERLDADQGTERTRP